jgi:hypothetical protein
MTNNHLCKNDAHGVLIRALLISVRVAQFASDLNGRLHSFCKYLPKRPLFLLFACHILNDRSIESAVHSLCRLHALVIS